MLQKRQLPKNSPALSDCAQSFVICPNDSYLMSTEQVPNFSSETESPEDMRAFSKERAESCGDSAPERTWRSHGPQSPAALQ